METMDKKVVLSTLWIFLVANFIYCDVFGLHHHELLRDLLTGSVGNMQITQEFLLGFSVLMEISMAMILVSRFMKPKYNRILNIISGLLFASVQTWSLTDGSATLHYWFFSVIEIATCISIVWIAWRWKSLKTALA